MIVLIRMLNRESFILRKRRESGFLKKFRRQEIKHISFFRKVQTSKEIYKEQVDKYFPSNVTCVT